jgi:hypothetical protein
MVIGLALMPHRQDGDRAAAADLEKDDIAGATSGNDELANESTMPAAALHAPVAGVAQPPDPVARAARSGRGNSGATKAEEQ